jgi:hypothetical protein
LDGSILVVADGVKGRNIDRGHRTGKNLESLLPLRGMGPDLSESRQKVIEGGFCFPQKEKVEKGSERFRIEKGRDAARHDKRVVFSAVFREIRDLAQGKNLQDVGIVVFKGKREGKQVKALKRGKGLQGEKPLSPFGTEGHFFAFGEEDTFCNHILSSVQKRVDDLQSEVRHADAVRVGVNESYRDPAAPILSHCPLFQGEPGLVKGGKLVGHVSITFNQSAFALRKVG